MFEIPSISILSLTPNAIGTKDIALIFFISFATVFLSTKDIKALYSSLSVMVC